jgi:hypothetical protein
LLQDRLNHRGGRIAATLRKANLSKTTNQIINPVKMKISQVIQNRPGPDAHFLVPSTDLSLGTMNLETMVRNAAFVVHQPWREW